MIIGCAVILLILIYLDVRNNTSTAIRHMEKQGDQEFAFKGKVFQHPERLVINDYFCEYSENVTATVYVLAWQESPDKGEELLLRAEEIKAHGFLGPVRHAELETGRSRNAGLA